MNQDVKNKIPNMEDMQEHARKIANKAILNEGTCSTAAATAAKAVTLGTTFRLVTGAKILVTFTNGITVASPTLAVTYTDASGSSQTTAAKPIYYRGAALAANMVKSGDVMLLKYNGTQWDLIGTLDTDTNTVTDVSFNPLTGKLQQTKDGVTTDITDVVKSGFVPTFNRETGMMTMVPKGAATIAPNTQTGFIEMTF